MSFFYERAMEWKYLSNTMEQFSKTTKNILIWGTNVQIAIKILVMKKRSWKSICWKIQNATQKHMFTQSCGRSLLALKNQK